MDISSFDHEKCWEMIVKIGNEDRPSSMEDIVTFFCYFSGLPFLKHVTSYNSSLMFDPKGVKNKQLEFLSMTLDDIKIIIKQSPPRFHIIRVGDNSNPASQEDIQNIRDELDSFLLKDSFCYVIAHAVEIFIAGDF